MKDLKLQINKVFEGEPDDQGSSIKIANASDNANAIVKAP